MTKKREQHHHHKQENSNNIHIHIHEKTKKHKAKSTKPKSTKSRRGSTHIPLDLPPAPSFQPTMFYRPPPFNYGDRPQDLNPYNRIESMLDARLKKFSSPENGSTDLTRMIGSHNARITIREDGSLHADNLERNVQSHEASKPEVSKPDTNFKSPDIQTVEVDKFGDSNLPAANTDDFIEPVTSSQNNPEFIEPVPQPVLSKEANPASRDANLRDANLREELRLKRDQMLKITENDIKKENERIESVSKASRLISTINADPKIVSAGDLSKEDWKDYRYVMEKVGHSVTNKQVGRNKMLENLEKYKYKFQEDQKINEQKKKDYEEENNRREAPGKKSYVQQIKDVVDNVGPYVLGAATTAAAGLTTLNQATQLKTYLTKDTINNIGGAAVVAGKAAKVVSEVTGIGKSAIKRKKLQEKAYNAGVRAATEEFYSESPANIENARGGGIFLEQFSNSGPSSASISSFESNEPRNQGFKSDL
jgi:hypothetical protein